MTGEEYGSMGAYANPVRGFRSWIPTLDGYLMGVRGGIWPPTEFVSECGRYNPHAGQAKNQYDKPRETTDTFAECECGFYAYWDLKKTSPTLSTHPEFRKMAVRGVVEGYTEVVVGELGFRARVARILAIAEVPTLWLPGDSGPVTLRDIIETRYPGVPIYGTMEQLLYEIEVKVPDEVTNYVKVVASE